MERMTAVCGLDCAQCEAYKATQANDEAAKERVAAHWREEYHSPDIDVAFVTCDGCLTVDGRLGGHCLECDVRACGTARGVPNCAHCDEYESCKTIAAFIAFVPHVKPVLDEIRRGL